jgi:hypothetical protein
VIGYRTKLIPNELRQLVGLQESARDGKKKSKREA